MDIAGVYILFPQEADCIDYLENIRWQGKPRCPYCKRANTTPLRAERRHHCNGCNTAFSVTVRTVFHRTRVPLQKWFLTISLMTNEGRDPSVRALAAIIGVDKNTAGFIARRVRDARASELDMLNQIVEKVRGAQIGV
jgi:transposase-like protein